MQNCVYGHTYAIEIRGTHYEHLNTKLVIIVCKWFKEHSKHSIKFLLVHTVFYVKVNFQKK